MSGRAAKALRRDIRRAVGPEAVGIIGAHTNAIDNQILPNLNGVHSRQAELEARIKKLEARIAELADSLRTVGR